MRIRKTTYIRLALLLVPAAAGVARAEYALTTLATFADDNNGGPQAPLIVDDQGNLFGTTFGAGVNFEGTVFELPAGSHAISTLATFDGDNGFEPLSGLHADPQGNLYGVTFLGGPFSFSGVIYKIAAGTRAFSDEHFFNGGDGAGPRGGLIAGAGGNLLGTTNRTVFQFNSNTAELTTLGTFTGSNGSGARGGMIKSVDGNMYGTTYFGGVGAIPGNGASGLGTVYKLDATSHALTTLARFNVGDGQNPQCDLVADANGNLFGTTQFGGTFGQGTVFEVVAGSGSITTLASFDGTNGGQPLAGLVFDAEGNLFGTSEGDGLHNNRGNIFKLSAVSHKLTNVIVFNGPNGSIPVSTLIPDGHGGFFGTTDQGGPNSGHGTIFQLTSVASSANWNVNADGDWSEPANWSTPALPNAVDSAATFGGVITAPRTVTVDSPQTVGSINFNSAQSYTIAGPGTITLSRSSGQALVRAVNGNHTISAPLTLASDTTFLAQASEAQTLTISGPLTATGHVITTVGFGIGFSNIRAAAVHINSGSTLILPNGTTAATSSIGALSIALNSELDLNDNDLQITGGNTYQQIATLMFAGLHGGGAPLGAAAILSSCARNDPSHRTLGTLSGAEFLSTGRTTFDGLAVSPSDVLVKYTFLGDSNLDGKVDVTDLGALATHWQTAADWTGGDLNYDGFVNVSDLGALATNWQAGVGNPLSPGSFTQALTVVGLGDSTVPEPSALAIIGLLYATGLPWKLAHKLHKQKDPNPRRACDDHGVGKVVTAVRRCESIASG
jgi:uncharacterized repeat protein (TIGR03803 family)